MLHHQALLKFKHAFLFHAILAKATLLQDLNNPIKFLAVLAQLVLQITDGKLLRQVKAVCTPGLRRVVH